MAEIEDNGKVSKFSLIVLIIYPGQELKKHRFCLHSSFNKYLPSTYHGPSIILGGEETPMNKVPAFKDGGGERNADNKQVGDTICSVCLFP